MKQIAYYNEKAFIVLAILGGIFSAFYGLALLWCNLTAVLMLSLNYKALSRKNLALRAFFIGTLVCIFIYWTLFFIPSQSMNRLATIIISTCWIGLLLFQFYQKPLFNSLNGQSLKSHGIGRCCITYLFYPVFFCIVVVMLTLLNVKIPTPVDKRLSIQPPEVKQCVESTRARSQNSDSEYVGNLKFYISCLKKVNTPDVQKFVQCGERYMDSFKFNSSGQLLNKDEILNAISGCVSQHSSLFNERH